MAQYDPSAVARRAVKTLLSIPNPLVSLPMMGVHLAAIDQPPLPWRMAETVDKGDSQARVSDLAGVRLGLGAADSSATASSALRTLP